MAVGGSHDDGLELAFEVDELPLRSLLAGGGAFSGLLREVAKAYFGASQEPATWLVHVEPGSVLLPVRPEPTSEEVSSSRLHELTSVIGEGLASIEHAAVRPDYFSDRALEHARDLAKVVGGGIPVSVRRNGTRTPLTTQLIANVEAVLGKDEVAMGTVEGALEALNVHGDANKFSVYDALSGAKVECNLTPRVTVEDLRPAIGRRVAVRGAIRARPDGRLVSIDAEKLTVFPYEDELPTPEDVLGLLRGYEVDEP